MKTLLTLILLSITVFAGWAQKSDQIFHYSMMDAMRNAVYEGDIDVSVLKKNGDFGLGTYNLLDGEMLALDGVFYRIAPDGQVLLAEDNRKSPFASIVFFNKEKSIEIDAAGTWESFIIRLRNSLPKINQPYAIRIATVFDEISVGGATKQSPEDGIGLATLMKSRPIYNAKKVEGTLVGFYNPAYVNGIDLSPFHFHFISTDRKYGGHMISGKIAAVKITIELDQKTGYNLLLPQNSKRFDEAGSRSNGGNSSY